MYVTLITYTKVQVSISFWSVSRTLSPYWGYLEDGDLSQEETWRSRSSLCHRLPCLTPKEDTLKCVKKGGGPSWGYFEDSEGSWQENWRTGSSLMSWNPCLTPRKILWKFCVDIFIKSVSRMGGPLWGYLEDVEGSWQENWRTSSSLIS